MLSGSRWYRLIITIVLQVIPVTSAEGESVKTFVADPPPKSVCLRHATHLGVFTPPEPDHRDLYCYNIWCGATGPLLIRDTCCPLVGLADGKRLSMRVCRIKRSWQLGRHIP